MPHSIQDGCPSVVIRLKPTIISYPQSIGFMDTNLKGAIFLSVTKHFMQIDLWCDFVIRSPLTKYQNFHHHYKNENAFSSNNIVFLKR